MVIAYYVLSAIPIIPSLILTALAVKKVKTGRIPSENRKLVKASLIIICIFLLFPLPAQLLLRSLRESIMDSFHTTVTWPDGHTCKVVGNFNPSKSTCNIGPLHTQRSYGSITKSYGQYRISFGLSFDDNIFKAGDPYIRVRIGRHAPSGPPTIGEANQYTDTYDIWNCDHGTCKLVDQSLSTIDPGQNYTVRSQADEIIIEYR